MNGVAAVPRPLFCDHVVNNFRRHQFTRLNTQNCILFSTDINFDPLTLARKQNSKSLFT